MTHANAAARRSFIPEAGRYRLDRGRSSVAFRTRHLFGLGTVTGTMAVTGGEITVDPAVPQASVAVRMSAASFSSGGRARDKDVRSARFLNAGQHPDITFRAGTLSRDGDRWTLAGELEIRAESHPVTLLIERAEADGAGFIVHATTRIDRYAFGLTAAKGMAARYLDIDLAAAAQPL
jgi:polyisoprenoid-binding protein YceI